MYKIHENLSFSVRTFSLYANFKCPEIGTFTLLCRVDIKERGNVG